MTALLAVALLVGIVAYNYLKPTLAASEPIQAIPIAQTTATTVPAASVSTGAATSAVASASPTVSHAASTAATPVASTAAVATTNTTYTIAQVSSKASFTIDIDEVLNGSPKTVVGTTDQVAGQIAVNPIAPSTAQLGTIQINARTLSTDNDQRNNAIKNQILETNDSQYLTFVPMSITGLPATATVGQAYTFQLSGQPTLVGQTHEATTTITYADWGISSPSVPIVTGVTDTVTLALDFTATAP